MFPLLQALYQQKWFYRLVCDRWTELRADGLVEDLFNTVTAAMRDYKAAFDRNYARWPVWGTLTNGLTTENAKAFRSQADAVRYLFRWIAGRVAWIDGRLGYVGQEDFSAWFRE